MKPNRILALLITLLLTLTVVSCSKTPTEPTDTPQISLPDINNYLTVEKTETIFISMDQAGVIESIKATNSIRDSIVSYYADYGVFNNEGNLNITNPKGPIIIENDKALIPSLKQSTNMVYTLSLNKDHYKDLVPYIITPTYKLNNKEVTFDRLQGANGTVELNYTFTPNPNTLEEYKHTFGAQVQIPIDISNSTIISASSAMQEMLLGQTKTFIYMILPNTSSTINIKIDARNFSFGGMEAVLQQISLDSFASLLPLDIFNDIPIEDIYNDLKDMFDEIPIDLIDYITNIQLEELNPAEVISMIQTELIQAKEQLTQVLPLFQNENSYKAGFKDKKDVFLTLFTNIETGIDDIVASLDGLDIFIESLLNIDLTLTPMLEKYSSSIELILDTLDEYNKIKALLEDFVLESLLNNEVLQLLPEVIESVDKIKNNLLQAIREVQQLPLDAEQLIYELDSIVTPLKGNISNLVNALVLVGSSMAELTLKLQEGLSYGWFTTIAASTVQIALSMLSNGMGGFSLSDLELIVTILATLSNLESLLDFDPLINMRKIDLLNHYLLLVNESLNIPLDSIGLSIYDLISLLKAVSKITSNLPPVVKQPVPSFLSNLNTTPTQVQFVIKQKGF